MRAPAPMRRNRIGAWLLLALLGAVVAIITSGRVAWADQFIDLRGSWDSLSTVGSARYPQTIHITSEDFSTGVISGTDGGAGSVFVVKGTTSGNTATFSTEGGGYKSIGTVTISGSGDSLTMTGTFTDTNGARGVTVSHLIPGSNTFGSTHAAPAITTALRAPNEVSWKPIDLLRSTVLAGGLLVLVGFPGQLFNSTLQAHYAEVMSWFGFLRRRRNPQTSTPPQVGAVAATSATPGSPAQTPWWVIGLVFLFSAFISGFVDPKFGFNLASVEAVVGIFGAIAVTTLIYTGIAALLMHRMYGRWGRFKIFPGGIAIVVACVVVTKVFGAQPGYIYGVMLSYSLGSFTIPKHHEGRLVAIGYTVILAASLTAWLLWTPVKAGAAAGSLPLVILSTTLAGVFMGGMCSLLFGLLPLRFLDGEKLLSWQRALWLVLFGVGMFLFVHVILNSTASSANAGRSYAGAIAFFALFGAASSAFWAYFRFRREPAAVAIPVEVRP
jgi:hypothetical protein